MNSLTQMVGDEEQRNGAFMRRLFDEYSSHETAEARFVKTLDLLDMYMQAYEYEMLTGLDLTEFFSNVPKCLAEESFFEPEVKEWLKQLMELRDKKLNALPLDSNMNTVLRDVLKRS